MKSTEQFKKVIEQHLQGRAADDVLFAETLKKPGKNIDDCVTYILNCVQKSGCNAFDNDEVYKMAVHYYDEDTIDIGKPVQARIVTDVKVELTPDDIALAKQDALDKVVSEEMQRLRDKPKKQKPVAENTNLSLW